MCTPFSYEEHCMRSSETTSVTDKLLYHHSKFAGDDFLAGALSDGEEEDALIDMDI